MVKRILFVPLVFLGLLFFGMTGKVLADAAALLEQAETYENNRYRQRAEEVYKTIVADYPGTDYALKAQSELVCLSITAKTNEQIQAAIDSLITNYSGHSALPAGLCDIAASFGWSSKYKEATGLYQQVILQYPDSSAVAKAELGISRISIISLIKSGDYSAAEAEISKMLEDFSGHPYLPAALYQIARVYQWSRQYEPAKRTYQQIIQQYPDSSQADRAWLDVARIKALSLIKSGDYTAAETEIDKLLQEFSDHPGLPVVLHSLAMEYERKAKYEKAASLHQQVVQQYPDNARAERAWFDLSKTIILSFIQWENYTTAEAWLDKFTADFGQNPGFAKAMFVVGEQYYHQGCVKEGQNETEQAEQLYQKAITVLNWVRQQSQSYEFTPVVWYLTGRCYRGLGDYEKVIECCGKVAADWPACKQASDAQFLVGRSYEKLAEAGVMSKSEAEPEIKAAYQQLLEKYPDCEATRHARRWLSRHNCR